MRVLHLHTGLNWGGGENQVLHLLKALPDRGVEPALWAHADGVLLRRAREEGLRAAALPSRRSFFHAMLDEAKPDLLHAQDSHALDLGWKAARHCGAPLLLSRRIASPLRRNWFSRRKYSPRRVRRVLAVSETVRQVMIRSGSPPEQIGVAPDGLDLDLLDRVQPDPALRAWAGSAPLLGGLGKLSEKKNWKLLIETAARLRDRGMPVRWVVAGEGPEEGALMTLIRQRDLQDSVRLLGFRDDPLCVLRSLDALFFPSIMEGASVTVREAMALGVPVIAADAEGTVESLGGCGRLVASDDPDGAADAAAEVLLHPAATRQRAALARERARAEFSLERTVEATLGIYRETLARNSHRPGENAPEGPK